MTGRKSGGDGARRGIGLWIVAAAAVILGAAVVFTLRGRDTAGDARLPPADTTTGQATPTGTEPVTGAAAEDIVGRTEAMRAAVRRYEGECAAALEGDRAGVTAQMAADCIIRLSAALDAVVASDTLGSVAIQERLDRYRILAAGIQTAPPGVGRASAVREVLLSAAGVIDVIRAERYEESLEVGGAGEDLRAAALALDPGEPLDRQATRLRRFFARAGELLSGMARPGDPGPGG